MACVQYLKQKKAQLAALGEWTHINCLKRNAREIIQDELLAEMLYAKPPTSAKPASTASQSRLERILDAVDLNRVMTECSPDPTVDEVPGGTISFLFERGSKAIADDDDQPEDDK